MLNISTSEIRLALAIAKAGQIAKASEQVEMSVASASVALKRLEQKLGFALFIRNTRNLRPTQDAERLLPMWEHALETLTDSVNQVDVSAKSISLRIAAPSDLGRNLLLDWLSPRLQADGYHLSLSLADRVVDFYHDGIDCAVRYGDQADSSEIAFKLCDVPTVVCGTPQYFERHGVLSTVADVARHNCLTYIRAGQPQLRWKLSNGSTLAVQGNLVVDDAEVTTRVMLKGIGIAKRSALDLSEHILSKDLVVAPISGEFSSTELWLVMPSREVINPVILKLRDDLREFFNEQLQKLRPFLET